MRVERRIKKTRRRRKRRRRRRRRRLDLARTEGGSREQVERL